MKMYANIYSFFFSVIVAAHKLTRDSAANFFTKKINMAHYCMVCSLRLFKISLIFG